MFVSAACEVLKGERVCEGEEVKHTQAPDLESSLL